LDRIPGGLSNFASPLIGFDGVEVDHGGWLPAVGGVRPLVVEPVHDRDEIQKATPHWQIGDVGASDLVGPIDPQAAQQIGVGLIPLCGLARVGLLEDRHQPHETHQPPDALDVHRMPFVLQVPGHLLNAVEGRVQELLVDQQHEGEVYLCLSLRLVVERGSGE